MRILTKFKDYYDYVQKFGQDPNLVYVRKQYDIIVPHKGYATYAYPPRFRFDGRRHTKIINLKSTDYYYHVWLYFCGKLYKYYAQHKKEYSKDYNYYELSDLKKLDSKAYEYLSKESTERYTIDRKVIDKIPHNVPVALLWRKHHEFIIQCNVNLTDFNFHRHFTPELAYQNIAQHLYNCKESKAKYDGEVMSDKVSDEDLAAAKGFDKFSFRKPKSKI